MAHTVSRQDAAQVSGAGQSVPRGLQSAIFIQGLQPFQDIFNVFADPDFVVESVPDFATFVYDVGHPRNSKSESTGNVVEAGDLLVGVGQEGEG